MRCFHLKIDIAKCLAINFLSRQKVIHLGLELKDRLVRRQKQT